MRWSINSSDLLMVLAATALLKPCFLRKSESTALASSFSAANKVGGTVVKLLDPNPEESSVSAP